METHLNITLLKISFIISITGILFLSFLANSLKPEPIKIENISNRLLNKKVQVSGTITSIKTYQDSNFQVISISDATGKIDITTNKILKLKKDQKITVSGTVKEYKQYLQIQTNKITAS